VPEPFNRRILAPLNKLLEANDRLAAALNATEKQWPYVSRCWIDKMSEPTKLLANHRLKDVEAKN
jgi:hypothetical protein